MNRLSKEEAAFLIFRDSPASDRITINQLGVQKVREFYFDQLEPMALGYTRNELYEIIDWHIDNIKFTTHIH